VEFVGFRRGTHSRLLRNGPAFAGLNEFPEPVTVAVSVKTADERSVAQKCAAGLFLWAAMLAFLLLRQQDPDSVGTEWPREEIRRGHFCFPGRFPAAGMRNSGRRADAAFRSPAGSRVAALGPAFCLSCAGARSAFRMDVQGGVARRVVAGHEARAHPFGPESRTRMRNSGRRAEAAARAPGTPRTAARQPRILPDLREARAARRPERTFPAAQATASVSSLFSDGSIGVM